MPYVIQNCPCFVEGIAIKGNEQKTQTCNNHKVRELTLCQDCTDCVLKQIVDLCKNNQYPIYNKKLEMIGYEKSPLSKEILQLLDIEEVE